MFKKQTISSWGAPLTQPTYSKFPQLTTKMLATTTDLFSQNEKNNDSANNTPVSLIATFNNPGNSESLSKMLLHCSFAGYKLSSKALVQNLPLLNGLYENILCIMALHAVLSYSQTFQGKRGGSQEEGGEQGGGSQR